MTTMDQGARAWMLLTVKKNYWRVAHWYGYDDLVQDGFMCWARVVHRYETEKGRVRSRRHLMQLFKTTFSNHIHDLSKQWTKSPHEDKILDVIASPSEGESFDGLECEGDACAFERLLAEAPQSLRPLLAALLRDGPSKTLRAAYRVRRDGTRETINERLCRLIGANPHDYDYATALRSFLTAA